MVPYKESGGQRQRAEEDLRVEDKVEKRKEGVVPIGQLIKIRPTSRPTSRVQITYCVSTWRHPMPALHPYSFLLPFWQKEMAQGTANSLLCGV